MSVDAVSASPAVGEARKVTSAVTRSWSDVDPVRLVGTYAATALCYSVLGQPFFLAIARQQYCKHHISAHRVLGEIYREHGVRGLYRGAGAAVGGTVLSEAVYVLTIEFAKEKLPLEGREWRSFGAGLLADVTSTPVFNPFAVVSQVQMVAGAGLASEHNYMSAARTAITLVREQGVSVLLRGTLLTFVVCPLTGAWWFVYESIKARVYGAAPALGRLLAERLPQGFLARLPECCRSATDNVLVNCGVGAATSMALSVVMNPIYVIRLRLQVSKTAQHYRFPVVHIVRELTHEGFRSFFKGLGVNMVMGVLGGCAFGVTYEGTKKLSDTSSADE